MLKSIDDSIIMVTVVQDLLCTGNLAKDGDTLRLIVVGGKKSLTFMSFLFEHK
jgi:hypothetical protein